MNISDIFKKYVPDYLQKYIKKMPQNHLKAINDILSCRTSKLGGNVYYCEKCEKYHYSYHSCKNRHCPKCGSQDSEKWLEKQKAKLLPVDYFMVTFTLPKELRAVCRSNQRLFYNILFKSSASALKTLLRDPHFAGGEAGLTGVLHTWTRQLEFHPHIHFIVPAGAFDFHRDEWNKSRHKFLIPVKALSKSFKKKFKKSLQAQSPKIFTQIPQSVWLKKAFITNSTKVGKGDKAFTYLSNYVYKTAITNNRIISCKDGEVTFSYKESETKTIKYRTVSALEFIRRFLQHVLPHGFQKVRYYGFLHSASKDKLKTVAKYFNIETEKKEDPKTNSNTVKNVFCRHCNTKMIPYASVLRRPRAPPHEIMLDLAIIPYKQINE